MLSSTTANRKKPAYSSIPGTMALRKIQGTIREELEFSLLVLMLILRFVLGTPFSPSPRTFGRTVRFSQPELEELERALSAGEDAEAPESESESPRWTRLHHAVGDGDLARVKLLLRFGANANAQDIHSQSPMHKVAWLDYGEPRDEEASAGIIQLLLAAGADLNARDADGDTPLSLAYRCGCSHCVRVLLSAGADPSISGKVGVPTPAFVVELIRNPDGAEVVTNILATGADVNAKYDRSHTLLDRAAFYGSPPAVRALLDAGANAGAETSRPPLFSTALLVKYDGGEGAVQALVQAGANPNMRSPYYAETPLHHATRHRSLAAIRLLLDLGADPNSSGRDGRTPLDHAVDYAMNDDNDGIMKLLLQRGAYVNGCENARDRPLHAASYRGHASTVRLLLESGADPHICNMYGETALHRATRGRYCIATVSALLEAGADPNAQDVGGDTSLHYALDLEIHRSQQSSLVIQLLNGGANPQTRGNQGRTALHKALTHSDCTPTLLSALLDAGADPNAGDDNGSMSLHYVVQYVRSYPIMLLLLKAGADPHSRDNQGHAPSFYATLGDTRGITPLYRAISTQSVEATCSLLRLGADPSIGPTPDPASLLFVIAMIGKATLRSIVAVVTQCGIDTSCFQLEGIDSELGQCALFRNLSDFEEVQCRTLTDALREEMLAQSSPTREILVAQLSEIYAVLKYYPWFPSLRECEVSMPRGRPSSCGGFADCWQGLFLGQHKIAMKTPRGSLAEIAGARRLAREAQVWCQLNHPNVLPFLGLYILDSVPYLVSPWMDNGHALDFVQKNPEADCLRLLAQVAKGLEYLHKFKPNPVIHGDLRGPNIFISQSGDACIADFGLSELIAETYETNYSTPFIIAGHPRWQAPEIIAAATKEAARRNTTTDAFSFGRVMLELLTKKIPFSDITQDILIGFRVMSGEVPPRPLDNEVVARGLDDDMWELMMACWDPMPSRRPSASDLVARLARAIEVRAS